MLSGTYDSNDVLFLLDEDDRIPLLTREEKERRMREGTHYSDLLSMEDEPSPALLAEFEACMERNGKRLAGDVMFLAESLAGRKTFVLVSLARAGTPLGCLIRRALRRFRRLAPHYGVSIIRDRGIDMSALSFIREIHRDCDIVFVDGWTGKGTIAKELRKSIPDAFLAVLADPGGFADLSASHEDWAIPFGMLNGCVSGGISRSVWTPAGFHACRKLNLTHDLSRIFLDRVEAMLPDSPETRESGAKGDAEGRVSRVMREYSIADRNKVKPGIAEAGRALFRRTPKALLLSEDIGADGDFLRAQAKERGVVPIVVNVSPYKAIALLA